MSAINPNITVQPTKGSAGPYVTSDAPEGKSAGRGREIASKAAKWCQAHPYEVAPGASLAALTALSWYEHLNHPGVGVIGIIGAGAAGAGWYAESAAKNERTKAAVGAAGLAVALADVSVNIAVGPSALGMIATAITAVGTYAYYVPWLARYRREHEAAGNGKAAATASPAPLAADAAPAGSSELPAPTFDWQPTAATPQAGSAEQAAIHRGLAALDAPPLAVLDYTEDTDGWSAIAVLPAGKNISPQAMMGRRAQLASNMGLTGRLRLSQGPASNQLRIRVELHDPLGESIPWPGPSISSVKQLMTLGLYSGDEPILLDLMKDHILVAGATDNGKSGVLNLIGANLAAASDAVTLGVDMKPGALELGPWRDTMLMLADGPEKAKQVMARVKQEMHDRGNYLASLRGPGGVPVRKWIPGDPDAEDPELWGHGPFWYLMIDELAELIRQAPEVATELITLNQVARAMGIRIIGATQSPSEKAFGGKGTDARQQYGTRIGLGVNEPVAVKLILGEGAYGNGWRLDDLDKPGKLMISSSMHRFPREGRAYWISDLQIVETASKYARTATDEDEDEPTLPGGGRPRLLKSVPCFPDGSQVPANRVPLWQALDRSGAKGATINDLLGANLPGINSRTAVSDPLQLWKARGWVIEVGTGPDRSKIFAVARHVKAA